MPRRWLLSAMHALIMIGLLFLWLSFDFSLSIEGTFLKWQSIIKHTTSIKNLYKPEHSINDVVFIDVSNNKIIAFDSSDLKNYVITDRRLLDSCFKAIGNHNNYAFILCDIEFDVPTSYDSALAKTLLPLKNTGFPKTINVTEVNQELPLSRLPGGTTSYSYISNWGNLSDEMVKFKLVQSDGNKSLPLYMMENLEKVRLVRTGNFLRFDTKSSLYLNNISVDAPIRNADLMITNKASALYSLTDFLTLLKYQDDNTNARLLKNKIIVIGDFSSDMHRTAFGEMPGVLILLNIFLSLSTGGNAITIVWIVYLFLFFTLLSHFIFYGYNTRVQKWLNFFENALQRFVLGKALSQVFINSVLLFIGSILSYYFFNKTIEIVALSLWLTLLEFILLKRTQARTWFMNKPVNFKNVYNFVITSHK